MRTPPAAVGVVAASATWAATVGIVFASAVIATAQDRAYQGTYEGAGNDPSKRILAASMAVAGGYDAFPETDVRVGVVDQVQLPGYFLTVLPMATYQSKAKNLNVSASAGSNGRYYNEAKRLVAVNHYAAASINALLTPRTDLFVGQSVSYSPAYLNRLFSTLGPSNTLDPEKTLDPSIAPAFDARTTDEGLSRVKSQAYGTTVNLTRKIAQRAAVTFTGGGRYTRFVEDEPAIPDLRGFEGGGYYSYALNKNSSLRAGYQYREAHFGPSQMSAEHVVEMGFALSHPWSKTRRTTLAVSAGPRSLRQTLRVDAPTASAAAGGTLVEPTRSSAIDPVNFVLAPPQVSVVGSAQVDHQVGQTWNFQAGVHRDVAYVEALSQPVFTNTLEVSCSGYFTPHVDFSMAFGHSYGESSFTMGIASPFQAYNGHVRMRVAVNRHWALYSEGVYDDYEFQRDLPIPNGISPKMKRIGIRGGVMLWVPVSRRR